MALLAQGDTVTKRNWLTGEDIWTQEYVQHQDCTLAHLVLTCVLRTSHVRSPFRHRFAGMAINIVSPYVPADIVGTGVLQQRRDRASFFSLLPDEVLRVRKTTTNLPVIYLFILHSFC